MGEKGEGGKGKPFLSWYVLHIGLPLSGLSKKVNLLLPCFA